MVFYTPNGNYQMAELFMKYKPDILTKNKAGQSPMDFVVEKNEEGLLKLLQQ